MCPGAGAVGADREEGEKGWAAPRAMAWGPRGESLPEGQRSRMAINSGMPLTAMVLAANLYRSDVPCVRTCARASGTP